MLPRKWLTFLFPLLGLGLFLGYEAHDEYQKRAIREEERLTTLAAALNNNIAEHLRSTSQGLEALRQDAHSLLEAPDGVDRLNKRMQFLATAFSGISTISLVSKDGKVVSSNDKESVGKALGYGQLEKTLKNGNDPSLLHLSPPFLNSAGNYVMGLGKVTLDESGKANGYLVATLNHQYFATLFKSLIYAADMRISVAHGDGLVIYSTQTQPDIRGVNLTSEPESAFNRHLASGKPTNFYVDRGTAHEAIRLLAIHSVWPAQGGADKVLVIGVSRSQEAVFESWKKAVLLKACLFVGLLVSAFIAFVIAYRRNRALIELRQEKQVVEKEMEERNIQFRSYFENMAVGVAQLDSKGQFQLVNDRYCEIAGYSRSDLLEKMRPSDLTHPDDRQPEQELMSKFFKSKEKILELEKRIVQKDGKQLWIQVSAHVLRDEDNRPKYTTAVIQDISHRRQILLELEEAKAAAEAANRAKTLFLGNMSHEMRTPLHQISGIARLFQRDPLTEKQTQRLALLDSSVKRLDTVIGGILTLVDIESQASKLALRPFEPATLLSGTISPLVERAEAKGLTLKTEHTEFPPDLEADVGHLKTILACFINNAITFSERGSITVRMRCIEENAESATLRLEVQDEGIGIAPEAQARLFTYFEQVDNSVTRKFGGTGVGLAIVKKLANLMDGEAGCQSVPDQGSIFWVTAKLKKSAIPTKNQV